MSNGNGNGNNVSGIPAPIRWSVYTFDKIGVSGALIAAMIGMMWVHAPSLMDALRANLHAQTETMRAVQGSVEGINESLDSVDDTMQQVLEVEQETQTFMPQVLDDHRTSNELQLQALEDHRKLCSDVEAVKKAVAQ
jgi:DNA-binding FrmR family transcriptional regulator